MKLKWITLFVVFLAAGAARADSVQSPIGPLYYPDGATVTSESCCNYNPATNVDASLIYSFADGTGYAIDPGDDGDVGGIAFSTPITAITFSYVWNYDYGFPFNVTFSGPSGGETFSDYASSDTLTFDFDEDVTGVFWIGGLADAGWGGITSLSYTLDPPVSSDSAHQLPVSTPEPGTLWLAGLGIISALGWKLRRLGW